MKAGAVARNVRQVACGFPRPARARPYPVAPNRGSLHQTDRLARAARARRGCSQPLLRSCALAGIALDPDLPSKQLGQAFGDGQAQPRAAVVASGGGIDLLKRFEQAALPIQRDPDAGIAYREMEQPLFRVAEKVGVVFVAERDV